MKKLKKAKFLFLFLTVTSFTVLSSCSKKADPIATVNVMAINNNKSGDVKGNGGSTSRTWTFTNSNTTAGWDMSMNATTGTFQLILKDAAGVVVLNRVLTAGVGVQSADGLTPAGTAGQWTATVTLTNFNGSGDYSFL